MIINDKTPDIETFKDINWGEIFKDLIDNSICMKINSIEAEQEKYNAVCLSIGCLTTYDDDASVLKLNAKLIIHNIED